jgi:hypothetical protein
MASEVRGYPDKACAFCKAPLTTVAIDGATRYGPWAWMCPACFPVRGVGLGTGRGQQFKKVGDKWLKTAG